MKNCPLSLVLPLLLAALLGSGSALATTTVNHISTSGDLLHAYSSTNHTQEFRGCFLFQSSASPPSPDRCLGWAASKAKVASSPISDNPTFSRPDAPIACKGTELTDHGGRNASGRPVINFHRERLESTLGCGAVRQRDEPWLGEPGATFVPCVTNGFGASTSSTTRSLGDTGQSCWGSSAVTS